MFVNAAPISDSGDNQAFPAQDRLIDLGVGRDFRIGNRDFSVRSPDGRIYYVGIYNAALTPAQVRSNADILLNSDDTP